MYMNNRIVNSFDFTRKEKHLSRFLCRRRTVKNFIHGEKATHVKNSKFSKFLHDQ